LLRADAEVPPEPRRSAGCHPTPLFEKVIGQIRNLRRGYRWRTIQFGNQVSMKLDELKAKDKTIERNTIIQGQRALRLLNENVALTHRIKP
jgi:hypothetical protein